MVQAFAAFGEEATDRRVGRGGLEELDARVAGGDQGGADVLVLDGLFVDDVEAEGLVEFAGLVDALDRDAEWSSSGIRTGYSG